MPECCQTSPHLNSERNPPLKSRAALWGVKSPPELKPWGAKMGPMGQNGTNSGGQNWGQFWGSKMAPILPNFRDQKWPPFLAPSCNLNRAPQNGGQFWTQKLDPFCGPKTGPIFGPKTAPIFGPKIEPFLACQNWVHLGPQIGFVFGPKTGPTFGSK